ncbi:MAG: hypothetical protein KTR31_37375 [Myxococcales bacterium]|nr:hypothetical protein [Myxococcales bacterium]
MTTLLMGLFLAAPQAEAAGVGSSIGVGTRGFAPTLDVSFEPFLLQLRVLDFLDGLDEEETHLGAKFYGTVHDAEFGRNVTGLVQPGVGLDIFLDPTVITIAGACRLGGEVASDKGAIGLFVVPEVGVRAGDNVDDGWFAGGRFEISARFGK